MKIFPARSEQIEDPEQKVRSLLGGREPMFVWVDNRAENERAWDIYPLFAAGSIILSDCSLSLGSYRLYIGAGCTLMEKGTGWEIAQGSGIITFSYNGIAAELPGMELTQEGDCLFPLDMVSPAVWGVGIRFVMEDWDEFLERRIWRNIISDVFMPEGAVPVSVCFFPAMERGRCTLQKDIQAQTAFWTTDLKRLMMKLPAGFSFFPAQGVDVTGHGEVYLTLSGDAMILPGDGNNDIMPGLAGTESIRSNGKIAFHPGKPACFAEEGPSVQPETAWIAFPAAGYLTQPQQMNFYKEEQGIYEWTALPGVTMTEEPIPVFPFGGLHGQEAVNATQGELAVRLEQQYLAPARKRAVEGILPEKRGKAEAELSYAVTAGGLKAAFDTDHIIWLQTVPLEGVEPGLAYAFPAENFWFSHLSPSLFLVMARLGDRAETPYSITPERIALAERYGYADIAHLEKVKKDVYLSKTELKRAVEDAGAVWGDELTRAFSHFRQEIAGWGFDLMPWQWEENGTVSVLKADVGNSMKEWMERPWLWSMALTGEEQGKAQDAFRKALRILEQDGTDISGRFLTNPSWRGNVFFHTGVDLQDFPDELRFLKAGMQDGGLYAAYVAYPMQTGKPGEAYPASALIVYEDDAQLLFEDYHAFGFRVKELRIEIEEGKIKSFRARAELLINELFGYPTAGRSDGKEGCSIIFRGSYQENAAGGFYAFIMEEPVTYYLSGSGIISVTIGDARLRVEGGGARFELGGTMGLLQDSPMDLFSFDALPFTGIRIDMDSDRGEYRFQADYKGLSFTPERGILREKSFGALFPARFSGMISSAEGSIKALGFSALKVSGFVDESNLGEEWTGFIWRIETGDMGGLAAVSKLTLELLMAFSEAPDDPQGLPHRFLGIRIAGLEGKDSYALPLQGVLSLGFESIELIREPIKGQHHKTADYSDIRSDKNGNRFELIEKLEINKIDQKDVGEEDISGGNKIDEEAIKFYFRFRNFSLTVLGKRFPESSNDLYLIGDANGNLGWYGTVRE